MEIGSLKKYKHAETVTAVNVTHLIAAKFNFLYLFYISALKISGKVGILMFFIDMCV